MTNIPTLIAAMTYPMPFHTPQNKGCCHGENHIHPHPMSDYQTIEPQAVEVGISPLFDGVTHVFEHDGQVTVMFLPAAAALAFADMVRCAANKILVHGVVIRPDARPIDAKEIVQRARPEGLDS
jgi:hypothetical protein